MTIHVSHSSDFTFDIIFLHISDFSEKSSTNIFAKYSQSKLKIPVKDLFRQTEYKIELYGLRNIVVNRHEYDTVVCYGESIVKGNVKL